MGVSGTYRPPKGPKWYPASLFCCTHEPPNPLCVLLSRRVFEGARRVHPVRLEEPDRLPHVLGGQPSGDDDVTTPPARFRQLPIEPLPRPAPRLFAPRIQQEKVRLIVVHHNKRLRASHPQSFDHFDAFSPQKGYGLRALVAVQLRVVEPDLADDPQHPLRLLVHKHPNLEYSIGKRSGYLPRLLDAQLARTLGEDEADR